MIESDAFSMQIRSVFLLLLLLLVGGSVPTDQFQPFRLCWQMMTRKKINPSMLRWTEWWWTFAKATTLRKTVPCLCTADPILITILETGESRKSSVKIL